MATVNLARDCATIEAMEAFDGEVRAFLDIHAGPESMGGWAWVGSGAGFGARDIQIEFRDDESAGYFVKAFAADGAYMVEEEEPESDVSAFGRCSDAIHHAIELIEATHAEPRSVAVRETLATLRAIVAQRGMESNNLNPGAAYLTSVMDTAIYG